MQPETLYRRALKPGDVFLDVGANVGQTARLVSPLIGRSGRCVSFEPEPSAFKRLATLAAEQRYSNVEPHCLALGDEVGHAVLHFSDEPRASEAATLIQDLATEQRLGKQKSAMTVPVDTLDGVCAARALRPAVIKIDVEGAEERVLRGAYRTLAELKPVVVFEFGYGFVNGKAPAHFDLLASLGYDVMLLELMFADRRSAWLDRSEAEVIEVSAAEIERNGLGGNMLAVPPGSLSLLEGITRRPFADVTGRLRFYAPRSSARLVSAIAHAERAALMNVTRAFSVVRASALAGIRTAGRLKRL